MKNSHLASRGLPQPGPAWLLLPITSYCLWSGGFDSSLASLGGLALRERPKARLLAHHETQCPAMPHFLQVQTPVCVISVLCAKYAQPKPGCIVAEFSHPGLPQVTLGSEVDRALWKRQGSGVFWHGKACSHSLTPSAPKPTHPIMPLMRPLLGECLWKKAAAQLEGSPQKWLQGSMGVWPSKSWVFLPQP